MEPLFRTYENYIISILVANMVGANSDITGLPGWTTARTTGNKRICVGHSLGGAIARYVDMKHPNFCDAVITFAAPTLLDSFTNDAGVVTAVTSVRPTIQYIRRSDLAFNFWGCCKYVSV